ncbi:Panacea domain-containing protein [Brevundimonas intermedia]|nr:type II toxin-antitoxin system antitoxin SocA domain-containing protein [Brevundimonas intermedia]
MAKTTALAVANYILDRAKEEGIPIRQLKLQKILYFCYAWYAGNKGEELFSEDVEAWQFGPVVREVYLEFKDCGSTPITHKATELDWETLDFKEPEIPTGLAEELRPVWDEYKAKSDAWLVEATHAPNEPWGILVKKIGQADKRQIPFSLIQQVYAKKVERIGA